MVRQHHTPQSDHRPAGNRRSVPGTRASTAAVLGQAAGRLDRDQESPGEQGAGRGQGLIGRGGRKPRLQGLREKSSERKARSKGWAQLWRALVSRQEAVLSVGGQ